MEFLVTYLYARLVRLFRIVLYILGLAPRYRVFRS
jgi:hypothetical protein